MFTGVIEATARILEIPPKSLTIERPPAFTDLRTGSSVCVSGVCLTVAHLDAASIRFDLTEETMTCSTFGHRRAGDHVNLERAMKAGDRLGGHVVQGHVEGVARVQGNRGTGERMLVVEVPEGLLGHIVPKGSIAIDGVSLTVASLDGNCVTIALIPHTIHTTILGTLKEGDLVNVETDVLVRSARDNRQSTVNCQLSTVNCQLSTVNCQLSTVSCQRSTVSCQPPRIGIVYADYYKEEIAQLLKSARQTLLDAGIGEQHISLHPVAGSFEIPLLGLHLAKSGKLDALIALGIIVEGETHHADLLAREVARGIMDVQLTTGVPFAFEVLHVLSIAQVRKRHHRGAEAARACLQSLAELRRVTPSE